MKLYNPSFLLHLLVQLCFTYSPAYSEFPLPERFKITSKSVFEEFNELLRKYGPLSLGSGSPDYTPPRYLQTALANVATSADFSLSQYSRNIGHPRLMAAVSKFYSKFINHTLHPDKNVLITAGASEALAITFLGHTLHNEEWIVFEPYYEHYNGIIRGAYGVPKFIKLKPKLASNNATSADWTFDREELSKAFNKNTKGVLLNTPHNPLGKVFTLEELTFIANLAKKWDILVVSDEVYQFLTFDNNKHISIASLPGMFERTITIASAGKLFGATGYIIGWAYGDAKLLDNLRAVHRVTLACAPTPIQEAVAVALEHETSNLGKPNSFFEHLKKETEANRNHLYRILRNTGMTPILPQGGYFMVANWTTIRNGVTLNNEIRECEDYKFAKWLIKNVKILGLPLSSFYRDVGKCLGKDFIRFAIIKKPEAYRKAEELFSQWKSSI